MRQKKKIKKIRTICHLWSCPSYDGVVATVDVKNNKILKIEGDKKHPQSKGYVCEKGRRDWQVIYHEKRFKSPLLKTENGFKEISWDEAYEIASEKIGSIIKKYGAKSICSTMAEWPSIPMFMKTIGSPNTMTNRDLCQGTAETAEPLTYGECLTIYRASQDFKNSKCILLVGTNVPHSSGGQWQHIKSALEKGAKLIVVDPRKTEAADSADLYLQIRPGTDGALALAMINVIINESLYDKKFVEKYCIGFDRLSNHIQQYTPEWASKITSIDVDDIKAAARMYATNGPSSYRGNIGVCQHSNSTQTCRAFAILISICGNIDIKGGNRLPQGPPSRKDYVMVNPLEITKVSEDVEKQIIGIEKFPLWSGPEAVMRRPHNPSIIDSMLDQSTYPIKGWIVFWNNPVLAYASSQKVIKAIKNLDFLMVMAINPSATSDMADLILPIKHLYEFDFICASSYGSWVRAMPKLVEAPENCRDSFQILHDIADILVKKGIIEENLMPWKKAEDFAKWIAGKGIIFNYRNLKWIGLLKWRPKYKKYKKHGFKTPSKKVELYSSRLEKFGYPPLPIYEECGENAISKPEIGQKFPLYLTSRRLPNYYLTRSADYPWVKKVGEYPELLIHPNTAQKRKILSGDIVEICTNHGIITHKAKISGKIREDTVCGVYGWSFPEKKSNEEEYLETNINFACSYYPPYDPVIGINCLQGVMCEVRKKQSNSLA